MNTITAIAVALQEASTEQFKQYAQQTLKNAQIMAEEFRNYGYKMVTGGTDNHMIILDFSKKTYKGENAEKTLDKVGISTSKSTIPDDPMPPYNPSGLRIGIQAMTTRGFKAKETQVIVKMIHQALDNPHDENNLKTIKQEVQELCSHYPIPS